MRAIEASGEGAGRAGLEVFTDESAVAAVHELHGIIDQWERIGAAEEVEDVEVMQEVGDLLHDAAVQMLVAISGARLRGRKT